MKNYLMITAIVFVVGCECEPWNPQQQATEWAIKMDLPKVTIDCYHLNDNCIAECSIGYNAIEGARTVVSVTCVSPDCYGEPKGKCWKVTGR